MGGTAEIGAGIMNVKQTLHVDGVLCKLSDTFFVAVRGGEDCLLLQFGKIGYTLCETELCLFAGMIKKQRMSSSKRIKCREKINH
jgi:hypothetical protein